MTIFTCKYMFMQIKIFSGEKAIVITDETAKPDAKANKNVITYGLNETVNAIALIENLKAADKTGAVIISDNIQKTKQDFFAQFEVIQAAGGIVQNETKDILFIFRRGKWDLPKGKLDRGETIEECAAREIEEETGVSGLTLKKKVGETFHCYREKEIDILKISHWYYFTCTGRAATTPQAAEQITEVKWIATRDIKEPMKNSYASIKEILAKYFDEP